MWIVRVALRRPYTFVVLALLILILSSVDASQTNGMRLNRAVRMDPSLLLIDALGRGWNVSNVLKV
jgi:hypothetical protein